MGIGDEDEDADDYDDDEPKMLQAPAYSRWKREDKWVEGYGDRN